MASQTHEKLARIAVVEDDADLRDTMLEYLKAQGYPAWGASSAEDFYRRFAADVADVVVLDIGLPGENVIGVARHLRELPDLTVTSSAPAMPWMTALPVLKLGPTVIWPSRSIWPNWPPISKPSADGQRALLPVLQRGRFRKRDQQPASGVLQSMIGA